MGSGWVHMASLESRILHGVFMKSQQFVVAPESQNAAKYNRNKHFSDKLVGRCVLESFKIGLRIGLA